MLKRTLIALTLLSTACNPISGTPNVAASEASGVEANHMQIQTSQATSENEMDFRNHIRQSIMKRIHEEAAKGKISQAELDKLIKNKDAINEWVDKLNQSLNRSMDKKAEQMAEERMQELNNIISDGAKVSPPVKRESLPPLGQEIYDRIKGNMPNAVINHMMPLGTAQLYFLLHLNNTKMPMITQKDAEYYISPTDLQQDGTARLWDKKGKEITDLKEQATVYQKMLRTVSTDKALQNKVPFKQWGKFNEKRVIYMLADPDCSFCRDQHQEFAKQLKDDDNLRIYYLMNPLPIHPEASDKVGKLLCTDNVSASWNRYVERSISNSQFPTVGGNKDYDVKTCQFLVSEHRKYSSIFNLGTTPTMITSSGNRYIGVHTWKQIKEKENW